MRQRFKDMMVEYGVVALVVYLSIFALTLAGFFLAIRFGWRTESVAGTGGAIVGAYVATKLSQPLRIGLTLVLTPIVARIHERVTGRKRVDRIDAPDASADR